MLNRSLLFAAFAALPLAAQTDPLALASPDGQIQFRLSISLPSQPYALIRPGYEIAFRGKPVFETSYLGLRIYQQDPILGENTGLIGHKSGTSGAGTTGTGVNRYNWLVAEYMQNGSLGRRLTLEVRAFNDGIAFRYVVPKTPPLDELLISDEATEFHFAAGAKVSAAETGAGEIKLPFVTEVPGAAWVEITEARIPKYPAMGLQHLGASVLGSALPENGVDPDTAVATVTPMTCPWRVILLAPDRAGLKESGVLGGLN
jgi:alpha-glucosidase